MSRGYIHPLRPYILTLLVCYVHYTLACNAISLSFEIARHFESQLARPPPFYMCMQTRQLPINIPLLLCYAVHLLYFQPIRLRRLLEEGAYRLTHKRTHVG